MKNAHLEKACELVGGQAALAGLVGVTPQAIYKWRMTGNVPAERVLAVEQATGGKVTRSQLRPDLYPSDDPPTDRDRTTAGATGVAGGKATCHGKEAGVGTQIQGSEQGASRKDAA